MPYSVGMVSLGCEKNRVDAEIMMASLEKAGFVLKDDAALADVAIVNTCALSSLQSRSPSRRFWSLPV